MEQGINMNTDYYIVITPEETFDLKPHSEFNALQNIIGGSAAPFITSSISFHKSNTVTPNSEVKMVFWCNKELLGKSNSPNKLNAISSLLLYEPLNKSENKSDFAALTKIYGNTVVEIDTGDACGRGFDVLEAEEMLQIFAEYISQNKEEIEMLHRAFDVPTP